MDCEGVLMPLIHEHPMMPFNDLRKGDCCGLFEATSDGYYCQICDFFLHKNCVESSESIEHPSHPDHALQLVRERGHSCYLCGRRSISDLYYCCKICNYDIDLCCAKYSPPEVIDTSERHHHKLTLLKWKSYIFCDAKCSKYSDEFSYNCYECGLSFHVDCAWHPTQPPLEVNHSYHYLHPLKLHVLGQLLDDYDGKCRFCERKIDDIFFYHCSLCNFTVDMRCVLNPPVKSLLNLKAHDHQVTLLPRLDTFTCNACGLKGDRSPYACFECGFMIHQGCLDLPRVININRHDHRVSRTSVLGVANSVCGVCRRKVDRTYGGFSCQKCSGYVVHSKCATRKDVWNGKELEGVPEEPEDIEPYVVIDENTIQHFSHEEHPLRLHVNADQCDENKRCMACTRPISHQSFYRCMDCNFILHQNCAGLLRMKRHFLHNERLTLVKNHIHDFFYCGVCNRMSNGFMYADGNMVLDVRCASISEPFFHPSHPDHPLYYTSEDEYKYCNCCNKRKSRCVMCIEDDCGFTLCFQCATLPFVVKHRVDDHLLSLCYGEKASGTYWCDICEKETDPKKWFYTCKDHRTSLHVKCVLGLQIFLHLVPGRKIRKYYEVVMNNSVSRPVCSVCKLRCVYPIILKTSELSNEYFEYYLYLVMSGYSDPYVRTSNEYFCSFKCWKQYSY